MWELVETLVAVFPKNKKFRYVRSRLDTQRSIRNWYSHNRFNKEKQKKLLGHADEIDLSIVENLYLEMFDIYQQFEKYIFNRNIK